MTERSLKDQLRRQLGFVHRSSQLYDDGYDDESIRIGVAVRVILHDTRIGASILKQMSVRDSVRLVSTVKPRELTPDASFDGISVLGGGKRRLVNPELGRHSHHELLRVEDWWSQVVIARDGVLITRKSAVLMAANKDGGAHVDYDIGDEGRLLRAGGFWTDGVFRGKPVDLGDIHLVAVRQFGFELLHSKELVALL
jgi:hypothetical protein